MKNFIERNALLVAGIAVISLVLTMIFAVLLKSTYDLQQETLTRFDKPAGDLLGPKGQIGWRSRRQIDIMSEETPGIVGVWVSRIDYEKGEYPIIHSWYTHREVWEFLEEFRRIQLGPESRSSKELDKDPKLNVRNSEEVRTGLIKCGPIEQTSLPQIRPSIVEAGKIVCRATVPPFDYGGNLAIIALVDNEDENSSQLKDVRRTLLRLQIDIFNREFQGRETWAKAVN